MGKTLVEARSSTSNRKVNALLERILTLNATARIPFLITCCCCFIAVIPARRLISSLANR
jgi:hypothetical protein